MYFPVCCLCVASGAVARVVNSPRPQGERETEEDGRVWTRWDRTDSAGNEGSGNRIDRHLPLGNRHPDAPSSENQRPTELSLSFLHFQIFQPLYFINSCIRYQKTISFQPTIVEEAEKSLYCNLVCKPSFFPSC